MSLKYNPLLPVGLDNAGGVAINGTLTGGTPNSVLFVGGTSDAPTIAQDNQGLNYNDSANRLSVFTTLGSEIVNNGTFTGSASGWTVGYGWAYSSNTVVKNSNGTAALTQTLGIYVLREYLLTYTISNWTVGTVTPTVTGGSLTGTAVGANGTYTERFIAATSNGVLTFTPTNTARFTIDSVSIKPLTGTNTASNINTGGLSIEGSWGNGSPGTTRGMTVNNDGSNSWTDYRFAGVLRGAFGVNSSGGWDMYASGGNYFAYYYGNSGLTSNSMFCYNYPTAFVHYGGGWFSSNVMAGATYAPTSTLQTVGSTALQVKRITSSQSIDGTATIWLSDATSASACAGTPSTTDCSSYTGSGQATCESHLPCSWYAGSSCSAFNNESGMGSCSGTSGCSADTSGCSGYDETSCLANDDAYGGSCAWSGTDCSGLDEGTCNSYSGSGCTPNLGDCSPYSDGGGDGSACFAYNAACSYDSGTGACTGTPYLSCSGTYYNCTGTYYTGNCSGTYGAACSGTVTCASYSSSGPCAAEAGCTWSSVLNLTLPDGETCAHRNYWIYNDATGGADTVIYPYSGQTVNETTSYTLAAYRDWVHFAYYKQTKDCSVYNEGACTPSGCTKNYAYCSWNSGDNTCSGDSSCTGIGDQSTCESTQYFTSCSGQETIRKNWYKVGS